MCVCVFRRPCEESTGTRVYANLLYDTAMHHCLRARTKSLVFPVFAAGRHRHEA
jgi:hypothetical protein